MRCYYNMNATKLKNAIENNNPATIFHELQKDLFK